jgi:hypothetical protein
VRASRPAVLLAVAGLAIPLAGSALAGRVATAPSDPTTYPVAQLYAGTAGMTPNPPMPPVGSFEAGFTPYLGSMHEHSGYSDGWAGSTPATYYAAGKHEGLDFMGGSDHSDFLGVPLSTSQYCAPDPGHPESTDPAQLAQDVPHCVGGDDSDETKSLRKWDATKDYARAATTRDYSAFQGFEWTSDIYGHINVYFSKNYENAKATTPTPELLYNWLSRRPEEGGGSDGIFTFNHPGAKDQTKPLRQNSQELVPDSTFLNWNDFAYDPRLDQQAVGMEVYNDTQEYGSTRDTDKYPEGYYAHVLDKGWHIGPIGAEDLGHRKSDDWGGPSWAKTVILSTNDTPAALKAAMLARRFYAVRYGGIRLGLTVDDQLMGSRLTRPTAAPLAVAAEVTWPGHTGLALELVTGHGKVVASGIDAMTTTLHPGTGSSYVFLRVKQGSQIVGYSAPVWVQAAPAGHTGEWLAGDLHVHTCYSHDAYCPRGDKGHYFEDPTGTPIDQVPLKDLPVWGSLDTLGMGDYNTDIDQAYTMGGTVQERFAEASLKGLDYLAITDHHSDGSPQDDGSKSVNDPGFGTSEVVGVPGYENSIRGHAQMLGATHVYPAGGGDTAGVNAMADALRADGGLLQANHPADGIDHEMTSCADTSGLHWKYGYDVRVESVEVWNTNHVLQRPMPASAANDDAVFYWECMLDKGWHVAATGGGDSHWMSVAAAQGVGNPTTWVFATERSARGVLDAVRNGRASISVQTPLAGATQLLLEADANRDGVYESMVGDTVPPGTPMRVRALGTPGAGLVEVRANGRTLLADTPLTPGGEVTFTSPATAGWVRATLYAPDAQAPRRQACDGLVGDQTTLCRYELGMLAMTSAIYLAAPVPPCDTRGQSSVCHPDHPATTPSEAVVPRARGGRLLL